MVPVLLSGCDAMKTAKPKTPATAPEKAVAILSDAPPPPKNPVPTPISALAESASSKDEESQVVTNTTSIPASPNSPDESDAFTVMTWNVEWFFDNEAGDNYSKLAKEKTMASRKQWDWKRDSVAAAIDQARPSVVALQEIENKRVLFYLRRSLARNHNLDYNELAVEGGDFFTEQDVGFMYRQPAEKDTKNLLLGIEPVLVGTFGRSSQMRKDPAFGDVSKHLFARFEVTRGDASEMVTIVTVHLRAGEDSKEIRTKQARSLHAWLASRIEAGENIIVLGDFNTEDSDIPAVGGTDMFVACGFETETKKDDLVDLHQFLPANERQTHLIAKKSFDRILVSKSLIDDDPSRNDLAFKKVQRKREINIKGNADIPDEHWNQYWEIDDANRDISDHWPVMATFDFK